MAGKRLKKHYLHEGQGVMPKSPNAWIEMSEAHELYVNALDKCPPSFTAKLWYSEEFGSWLSGYNWRASDELACRYICHELSEYITLQDYGYLFDGIPGLTPEANAASQVYYYNGSGNPDDLRHLIACEVERIIFDV